MADNIGDLAVQLSLDASQFVSNLDKSAAKMKAVDAGMNLPGLGRLQGALDSFDLGKVKAPTLDVAAPRFGKIAAPEVDVGKFTAPEMHAPKMDLPKLDYAGVDAIKAKMADIDGGGVARLRSALKGLGTDLKDLGAVGKSMKGLGLDTTGLDKVLGMARQLGVGTDAAGLERMRSTLKGLGGDTSEIEKAQGLLKQLGGEGSTAMGQLASAAKVAGIAVAGIAVAAAGAGYAIKLGFDWIKAGVDDVADVGRQSLKLGVSTEKLSALQFAAGRDSEAWTHALKHLGSELGAAGQGSEEARKKFRALGLDGQALAAMGMDRAIDAIADRFKDVTDGAARARMATELFSRDGAVLIPTLEKGAAGFAEADAAARKFGQSVSSLDAAKAMVAQRAMDDVGRAFQGLQRAAAVEFAPLLTNISTGLTDLLTKGGGGRELFKSLAANARSFIVTLLGGIETIVVALADKAQQMAAILDSLTPKKDKDKPTTTIFGHEFKTDGFADFFGEIGMGGDAKAQGSWGEALKQGFEDAKKIVAGKDDKNDPVKKFLDMMDKLGKPGDPKEMEDQRVKQLLGQGDDLNLKLDDQIAGYGLVGEASERAALSRKGLTDAQLSGVDASIKELTALRGVDEMVGTGLNIFAQNADKVARLNDLWQKGSVSAAGYAAEARKLGEELNKATASRVADIVKQSAAPLDKFKADMEELDKLGLKQKDPTAYAAEVAKDFKGLGDLTPKVEHPGAALEGSADAYNAILNFEDQGKQGDVQERIAAKLEALLKQQEATARTNQQIADAISRIFKKGA